MGSASEVSERMARAGSLEDFECVSAPDNGFARPAIARRLPLTQSARIRRMRRVEKPSSEVKFFIPCSLFVPAGMRVTGSNTCATLKAKKAANPAARGLLKPVVVDSFDFAQDKLRRR